MRDDQFRLYDLENDEFQALAGHICSRILGTGTVVFAPGKDGGRDGKFSGTANNFPSATKPASGEFIIQAKHTNEPYASTGNKAFTNIWAKELVKVKKLVASGECDVYLLFTNRRSTAAQKTAIVKSLKALGVKQGAVYCRDTISLYLSQHPDIVDNCGLNIYKTPFKILPKDLSDVIGDFHNVFSSASAPGGSLHDLRYIEVEKKNVVNKLGKDYFDYIKTDSMPYFLQIREFLENPRNSSLRDKYHATADEIKGKLLTFQENFSKFEEAFVFLYDMLIKESSLQHTKRKLVNVFLHYMYCDCDIGKRSA